MRRAQGEYVMVSLAVAMMILVSLLAYQWITAIQRSGEELIEKVIAKKERLIVLWNRNSSNIIVVNQWDGESVLRALVTIPNNPDLSPRIRYFNHTLRVPIAHAISKI